MMTQTFKKSLLVAAAFLAPVSVAHAQQSSNKDRTGKIMADEATTLAILEGSLFDINLDTVTNTVIDTTVVVEEVLNEEVVNLERWINKFEPRIKWKTKYITNTVCSGGSSGGGGGGGTSTSSRSISFTSDCRLKYLGRSGYVLRCGSPPSGGGGGAGAGAGAGGGAGAGAGCGGGE